MGRKFTRIHSKGLATLVQRYDKYEDCEVEDLSLTGMFVKGVFPVNIEQDCFVFLDKNDKQAADNFQASAKVIRRNDHGVAIEFSAMTIESYMFLQVILLYEAEKPLNVMVELPDDCPFKIIDRLPTTLRKLSV